MAGRQENQLQAAMGTLDSLAQAKPGSFCGKHVTHVRD
jgi:hypothetical protein